MFILLPMNVVMYNMCSRCREKRCMFSRLSIIIPHTFKCDNVAKISLDHCLNWLLGDIGTNM